MRYAARRPRVAFIVRNRAVKVQPSDARSQHFLSFILPFCPSGVGLLRMAFKPTPATGTQPHCHGRDG